MSGLFERMLAPFMSSGQAESAPTGGTLEPANQQETRDADDERQLDDDMSARRQSPGTADEHNEDEMEQETHYVNPKDDMEYGDTVQTYGLQFPATPSPDSKMSINERDQLVRYYQTLRDDFRKSRQIMTRVDQEIFIELAETKMGMTDNTDRPHNHWFGKRCKEGSWLAWMFVRRMWPQEDLTKTSAYKQIRSYWEPASDLWTDILPKDYPLMLQDKAQVATELANRLLKVRDLAMRLEPNKQPGLYTNLVEQLRADHHGEGDGHLWKRLCGEVVDRIYFSDTDDDVFEEGGAIDGLVANLRERFPAVAYPTLGEKDKSFRKARDSQPGRLQGQTAPYWNFQHEYEVADRAQRSLSSLSSSADGETTPPPATATTKDVDLPEVPATQTGTAQTSADAQTTAAQNKAADTHPTMVDAQALLNRLEERLRADFSRELDEERQRRQQVEADLYRQQVVQQSDLENLIQVIFTNSSQLVAALAQLRGSAQTQSGQALTQQQPAFGSVPVGSNTANNQHGNMLWQPQPGFSDGVHNLSNSSNAPNPSAPTELRFPATPRFHPATSYQRVKRIQDVFRKLRRDFEAAKTVMAPDDLARFIRLATTLKHMISPAGNADLDFFGQRVAEGDWLSWMFARRIWEPEHQPDIIPLVEAYWKPRSSLVEDILPCHYPLMQQDKHVVVEKFIEQLNQTRSDAMDEAEEDQWIFYMRVRIRLASDSSGQSQNHLRRELCSEFLEVQRTRRDDEHVWKRDGLMDTFITKLRSEYHPVPYPSIEKYAGLIQIAKSFTPVRLIEQYGSPWTPRRALEAPPPRHRRPWELDPLPVLPTTRPQEQPALDGDGDTVVMDATEHDQI